MSDTQASSARRLNLIGGSVGVFVHWFDWAAYAYLATTIADLFFPSENEVASLLSTFAVFAISFAVRPLGAFVFGPLGDRIGRRHTLAVVVTIMSAATFAVGILPTYSAIGIGAPLLLLAARLLQGLAAGGEFGSAAAFLAEHAPRKKRGLGVSWLEVGSLAGFLAASLLVYILDSTLTTGQMESWGWRIPFLIAAPLGVIGYVIRSRAEDTPAFLELEETDSRSEAPVRELFATSRGTLFRMFGIQIMQHVSFYLVLVYLVTYQVDELGYDAGDAALASTLASLLGCVLVPVFGALSDRIGRRPLLFVAGAGMLVASFPLFILMRTGGVGGMIAATMLLGVFVSAVLSVHATAFAELFPTRVRQAGLSIGYNVIAAIFAGTVPFLMTWLQAVTGSDLVPAVYLALVGAIGLITTFTMRETAGVSMHDTDGPQPPVRDDQLTEAV